jgi:hypothetical protein
MAVVVWKRGHNFILALLIRLYISHRIHSRAIGLLEIPEELAVCGLFSVVARTAAGATTDTEFWLLNNNTRG